MKTLAILSPNKKNAYSETFIRAHKNLPFNIKFYYGGFLPTNLEASKSLFAFSVAGKIKIRADKNFNLSEHALAFSLKREKVDFVLAEYGPTACACLKVIEALKLPMVVHFHGFDASHKATIEEYAEQYKKVFSYAKKIIAVSKRMKIDIINLGCPENKVVIATYGPDPVYFENKPHYSSQQFIAVGRFTDKKAPSLTILAFKQVVEAFPEAKLVMGGDGELWNTCKNLAKAIGLANNIAFKGVLTPLEIKAIMQDSVAFVQHSIVADNGDSEGTPLSVLEAQAAALPVVATYHAGIPDVVINNETGLLGEEQDVNTMSKNMIRLLTEKGLAEKLGSAGRKRVQENFSMEKHLNTITDTILYEN